MEQLIFWIHVTLRSIHFLSFPLINIATKQNNKLSGLKNGHGYRRDFVGALNKMYGIPKNTHVEVFNPHPRAQIIDHDFQSPTYREYISTHIDSFVGFKGYQK